MRIIIYYYYPPPDLYNRTAHRNKKMTEERKCLLNSIGFVWESSTRNKAPWEEMYQRLVVYKKEHKDTNVPSKYKEDPKLGQWVPNQRFAYWNKKMTEERKRLLDSIGFLWELSTKNKATWEEMYCTVPTTGCVQKGTQAHYGSKGRWEDEDLCSKRYPLIIAWYSYCFNYKEYILLVVIDITIQLVTTVVVLSLQKNNIYIYVKTRERESILLILKRHPLTEFIQIVHK